MKDGFWLRKYCISNNNCKRIIYFTIFRNCFKIIQAYRQPEIEILSLVTNY